MMDIQKAPLLNTQNRTAQAPKSDDAQALFMREKNDRMAGSAPEWRSADSAREKTVFRLSEAAQSDASAEAAPSRPDKQNLAGPARRSDDRPHQWRDDSRNRRLCGDRGAG